MINLNRNLLTEGTKEDPFVLEMSHLFSKMIFTTLKAILPKFSGISKRDALIHTDVLFKIYPFKIDLSKPGYKWMIPGAEKRWNALKINDIEVRIELASQFNASASFGGQRIGLRDDLYKIKKDILDEEDKKRARHEELRLEGVDSAKNMTYFDTTKQQELFQLDDWLSDPMYVSKIKKIIQTKMDEFEKQNKHKYPIKHNIECNIFIDGNQIFVETKPMEFSINKSIFPKIRQLVYSVLLHETKHAHQNITKNMIDAGAARQSVKILAMYDFDTRDISEVIKRFDPDTAPEVQLYSINSILKHFPVPTKKELDIVAKSYATYYLNPEEVEAHAEQYMFETKNFKKEKIKNLTGDIKQETENGNKSKAKSLAKELNEFKKKSMIDHFISLITEKFEEISPSFLKNLEIKFKTIATQNKMEKVFKNNKIYGQNGDILTTKEVKDNFINIAYGMISAKKEHYKKCAKYIKQKYDKGGSDKLSDTSKKIYDIEKLNKNLDILEQKILNDFRSKIENDYQYVGEPNLKGRSFVDDVDWNP
jgi:hypothetical protein